MVDVASLQCNIAEAQHEISLLEKRLHELRTALSSACDHAEAIAGRSMRSIAQCSTVGSNMTCAVCPTCKLHVHVRAKKQGNA
jgi:hypothetical protein